MPQILPDQRKQDDGLIGQLRCRMGHGSA